MISSMLSGNVDNEASEGMSVSFQGTHKNNHYIYSEKLLDYLY